MQHRVLVANLSDAATSQAFQLVADWTSSGLVESATWIDTSKADSLRVLNKDGTTVLSANQWASTTFKAGDSLQVFSFQFLRDGKGALAAATIETALNTHSLFVEAWSNLVNVIVPVDGLSEAPAEAILNYRLNVIAAPVEGEAPTAGTNLIIKKSEDVFSHAAAAIVSVAGIWKGQTASPAMKVLGAAKASVGQNMVISRNFVRYIDASDLVGELVGSVAVDGQDRLPSANDSSGTEMAHLVGSEAQIAVDRTYESFREQNRSALLYQGPKRFKPESLTEINFAEAVKLYFAFIFKWLWAAPGDYVRSKVDGFKAQVARLGQQMLGADSEFDVIFKGTSSRTHDSSVDINLSDEILDAVRAGLKGSVTPEPAAPKHLWFSMVKAASSLADGGDAFGDIQMPTIGSKRVSVLDPNLITPNAQSNHFDVPAGLPVGVSGVRLRSDDPYSALVAFDQAEKASASSGSLNAVAFEGLSKLKTELRAWIEGNTSFVWKIGAHLATQLNGARGVAQDLQRLITEVDEQDFSVMAQAELKARKALARMFFGGLAMLALGGIIWLVQAFALFLINNSWPGSLDSNWGVFAAIFAGVFLIWNIVSILVFNGKVGELFNLQRKLREQEARREWAEKNQQQLLLELHRLASLYGQYRLWAKAISPVFHREAVEISDGEIAKTAISKLSNLPASVVVATLSPTPAAKEQILAQVQRSYYSQGWVLDMLEKFVAARGFNAQTIWEDTGFGANSPLSKFASSAIDDDAKQLLSQLGDASAKALVASESVINQWTVSVGSGGRTYEVSAGEFFASIRTGGRSIPTGSMLSELAAINDRGAISTERSYFGIDSRLNSDGDLGNTESFAPSLEVNRNLDLMAVRVEFSELTGVSDFAFIAQEKRAETQHVGPGLTDQPDIEG